MPRRYRPPVKRRKTRKRTTISDLLAQPVDVEEVEAPVRAPAPAVFTATAESSARGESRHVTRDYSYVRSEVLRIVLIAGFIIVSLVITAILRS